MFGNKDYLDKVVRFNGTYMRHKNTLSLRELSEIPIEINQWISNYI